MKGVILSHAETSFMAMAVSASRFLRRVISSKHGHLQSWKAAASTITSQRWQQSRSQRYVSRRFSGRVLLGGGC